MQQRHRFAQLLRVGGLLLAFVLNSQVLPGQTIRIMPLGDSITRGDGGSLPYHGYRDTLASRLQTAGLNFDLVGLRNDGDGSFDGDHQGIPGVRADQIADSLNTFLSATDPDIVLVHAGTNDISVGEPISSVIADLETSLNKIHAFRSTTKIVLSGIIPRTDDAALNLRTRELNDAIRDLVNKKRGEGFLIWFVDHYENFQKNAAWASDYMSADGIHPNDLGYKVMADLYFQAIQQAIASNGPLVVDDFNRPGPGLGSNWDADPAYQIVNNQLSNTSPNPNWLLATWVANANPVEVSFRWAGNATSAGINEGGLALMLDAPSKTANGYLVWMGTSAGSAGKKIILWTIQNGAPGQSVAEVPYSLPEPAPNDTFKVRLSSDANGHHFDCYINGTFYGRVSDTGFRQGNTAPLYAGIMLKGGLDNDVDDFTFQLPSDITPPAKISDLTVTSVSGTSVTLQWTAPGDDGNTGKASKYDLRYSTNPITDSNFGLATQVSNVPDPADPGTVQTVTVGGLSTGTKYYFRIRTRDDAGNVSELSNEVSATTSQGLKTVDNFNRSTLGPNWTADPAFQIVNNELHNTSNSNSWAFLAIYNAKKNPIEVGYKWSLSADPLGIDEGGFALRMDAASTTANGYLLFRRTVTGTIELWTIVNGAPSQPIASKPGALANPNAGDEMVVRLRSDASGHHFDLYINGQFDGTVSDPNKLQGNSTSLYAGVMLKGNRNNGIDDFYLISELGSPSRIVKVSGDNQKAPAGEKLPNPLVVQVTDDNGNPIKGATVDFSVLEGGGQIINPPAYQFRVDVGGLSPYVDQAGRTWNADQPYTPGSYGYIDGNRGFVDAPIANTVDDPLYQTERWNISRYRIDVPNGEYTVYLHFAELVYQAANKRVFSVKLEGVTVLNNFDIFAAGGFRTAVVRSFNVNVKDGVLDIDFVRNIENPSIHAIEVVGKAGAAITGDDGTVSREYVVGPTIGTNRVQVAPVGFSATPVVFVAEATAGAPSQIVKISGDNQSGPAGQPLPQPLVVEVRDAGNNPVANADVLFMSTQGGGTFAEAMPVKTGADGRASATFIPGAQNATNKVVATVSGLANKQVTFTTTVSSGVAARIEKVSGDNQSGQVNRVLPQPLVVRVVDANNQPVKDYPVDLVATKGGAIPEKGRMLNNPRLDGTYNAHGKGIGKIAPSWGAWNQGEDGSQYGGGETHSEVQGADGSAAQRMNTTGSAMAASISQTIAVTKSPPQGTRVLLSFYYRATGDTNPAMRVILRKTLDSVLVQINLPPTNNQWVHHTSFFTWDKAYEPLQIHLVALNNVIVDIDNVNLYHVTDAQGRLSSALTLGPTAGPQEIQAIAEAEGTPLTGSPVIFNATATAGPAHKIVEVSGNNQIGSANQPLSNPLKVQVQDEAGNPVAGHNVTFTVVQGGGRLDNNSSSYTTTTDANGFAQATLTLGPTTGVINEVHATAKNGNTDLVGSPVVFRAEAAVPAKMVRLSPQTQNGTATQPLPSPLKVQITDAQNRPISGFDVTFRVTQGGGKVNGQSEVTVRTQANGEAAAVFVLGPNPGGTNKVEVLAVFNGTHLAGSPLVFTATAAPLSQLVLLEGNNQTGIVGSELGTPLKTRVIDQLGNGVKGWNVEFRVVAGGGKLDGKDTLKVVQTDSLGIAQVKLTLGPRPGVNNNKVVATSEYQGNNLAGSPITFQASASVGPPVAIEKAGGDNQRGVVGSPLPEPLKVKVVDALGNGVANHDVIFEVKAGGGSINGQSKVTVKTNGDGIAQVTLVLGTIAGENNNRVEARAFSGGTPLGNSPLVFTASATNSPARFIQYVSGSGQQGRAGEALAQKLVVRVTDGTAARNPVPNHPVTFRATKGGGTFNGTGQSSIVVAADANGQASVTWYLGGLILPDSQQVEASATDGQVALNGSPVVFKAAATAGDPSPTKSVVQATGPVPADGTSLSHVTVFLKDAFGNPISGHAVIIRVSGTGNNINQPLALTDAQGKATGSFSSTRAEWKMVTAFDLNAQIEITNGARVRFESLAPARLVMAGGNNQTRNVGTALAQPLQAMVTDVNGNPVPGHPVRFDVESGGGYFVQVQPVRTDSNGIASVTYILGQNPGQNIIKATALNLNVPAITFTATGKVANPRRMTMVSGNEQTGVAGQNLPAPLVVLIVDQNGDPVFNHPVTFRVTFGGGSINGAEEVIARTNAFGQAQAIWKLGDQKGPNVLWAISEGLEGSPQIFTAQGTSGQPERLELVDGDGQSGTVGQMAPRALVARVTDRIGNEVSGVIVRFQLVSGSGSLSASQATTGDDGMARVNFTFGQDAGVRIVRAYSDGLMNSPITFRLFGRAAAPKTMVIHDGNNQSGTINKPLSRPIRVRLFDQYNNPVPGANVTFVVTAGGGGFVEPQPVRTDDRGIAAATWILGPNQGQNKVWAVVNGVANSPLEFTATASTNNYPEFTAIDPKHIKELDRIEFEVKATDADNDPISYGARKLPSGATFDSLVTHIFTWQTGYNDAGVHEIVFTARDSKGAVSEYLVTITVDNVNRPPTLTNWQPAASTVNIPGGQNQMFQIQASDPDGDQVEYLWYLNGRHVGSTNTYLFQPFAEGSFQLEGLAFDRSDTTRRVWTVITAVNLVSFSASSQGDGVVLNWITAGEYNNLGFNILRSTRSDGPYQAINETLIRPDGSGMYSFVDRKVNRGGRYFYMLEVVSINGETDRHGPIAVQIALPETFALYQNYPNPFNPSTTIRFDLPKPSRATLIIFNALGQEVIRLVDGELNAGSHTVLWDGKNRYGIPVPSGVYYFVLRADRFTDSKKMLLLK